MLLLYHYSCSQLSPEWNKCGNVEISKQYFLPFGICNESNICYNYHYNNKIKDFDLLLLISRGDTADCNVTSDLPVKTTNSM